MTQRPRFNPNIARLPSDVYSAFGDRIHDHPGPLFPMHVGDTWLEPFVGARVEDIHTADHPGLHNYCDTRGRPELVDALIEKVRAKNGLPCERESLLVSAGATSGLACAVTAIVSAGDEVLVLAPFWPLIRGIVQATGGKPVEVPFYDRIHSAGDAVAALEERVSERTVALYVSTPSNPTGVVLPRDWLEAMSEFAARHGLWLLSDEVYEDFVYRGEHFSVGTLAPERTVSFFSFSKAYGMAGNRVGYLVGPSELVDEARKVGTHTYYSAPTPCQLAALAALRGGDAWQKQARDQYREVGGRVADALGLPAPGGSTFLFVPVAHRLDERGLDGFLEDCFEDGVLVAPGASSGVDYSEWIRLCYTVMPPAEIEEGIRRLARRVQG
jgi:aspartate/methionine/tyrosine aminotransferase